MVYQKRDDCPHCGLRPLPCPFCGKPAVVLGQNAVACSDWQCGAEMDWGHWCGETPDGVPAEHYVIEHWNQRAGRGALD